MSLTVKDLEKAQQLLPDYRMELHGEIVVMSPAGLESDEVAAEIIRQLGNWVRPCRLGRVTASSAGYVLPNVDKDVRAPTCSFIWAERLKQTTRKFAQLVLDLMVEVASASDSLGALRTKIRDFLSLGTIVGPLVDIKARSLAVHSLNQEPVTLHDGDVLALPDLLPGWELAVDSIWAPEFEQGVRTLQFK